MMSAHDGGARALYLPFPESLDWADILHWSVAVMDRGDSDLAFTASLLSHAIGFAGLTAKQAKYAEKIVERVVSLYRLGELDCQQDTGKFVGDAETPAGHA